MTPVQIGKRHFEIADSWNKLTKRQLLIWADYCVNQDKKNESLFLRKVAFAEFSGWQKLFVVHSTNHIQRMQIGWTMEFLTKAVDLTKILVNEVSCLGNSYYGPSDELKNVIVDEFVAADTSYLKYIKNNNSADLDKMAAILYRKNKTTSEENGDNREPYNKFTVESRTKLFSKIPMHVKHAILLQYMGCRQNFITNHPHVFTKATEQKIKNFGWPGIITDLAGAKHGTDKEIQRRNIGDVFFIMEKNEVRRLEFEAANKT